eukprot:Sspe_Gene.55982::Locus_30798_Transcript_1_1_Confidence_1.000_Length_1451::g.55982::m.55982/K21108/BVES; blood vessel epicardial substance
MSPTILPANSWVFQLANVFLFLSYVSFDILVLRFVLAAASFCFCMWAWFVLKVSLDTFIWNGVFFLINVCHGCYLLWQKRPVKFGSDELEQIYEEVFSTIGMSRMDFKLLSDVGFVRTLKAGSTYVDQGGHTHYLSVLISGTMVVTKDGTRVNDILPNEFLDSPQWAGRASLFTVALHAKEDCRYLMWPVENLERLTSREPRFKAYLEGACGVDIAHKLFASDETLVTQLKETQKAHVPRIAHPLPHEHDPFTDDGMADPISDLRHLPHAIFELYCAVCDEVEQTRAHLSYEAAEQVQRIHTRLQKTLEGLQSNPPRFRTLPPPPLPRLRSNGSDGGDVPSIQ